MSGDYDQGGSNVKHANQNKGTTNQNDCLTSEFRDAIRHMVANISKSFIVEWYTSISPTNHDFVASCESLIENALTKLAEICVKKLDKYKTGQLVASLLHDHVLRDNDNHSIESQIDDHEYDICQNLVVRLFGLLSTDDLRRVIFTQLDPDWVKSQYQQYYAENREFLKKPPDSSASDEDTRTTSALYTLVIAMLTKAVFMPIVASISEPKWLYAVIIWLCKKEERERMKRSQSLEINPGLNDANHDGSDIPGGIYDASSSSTTKTRMPRPITSITVTNTKGLRSVDLEEGIDIAAGNINFDNPVCDSLKRPLDNIEIYGTEEVKSTNSCYVLYCISYDGICFRHPSAGFSFIPEHDVPVIDKRATHLGRRLVMNEPSSSRKKHESSETSARKSFWRRMIIKRRFREFVLLQLRLEENPKIRPYMKNIPKPTKLKAATQNIFSLPGITNIKLDQSTIKLRQRFLERFLVALNSSPFIANSYEFKEFFSYNSQSAISMSKSKALILQVNLNKVFMDSVKSAFSMIRASLPGDGINLSTHSDPDAWLTELQQSTLKLHVQTRTSHSKMRLEKYLDSKLLSIEDSPIKYSVKTRSLSRQFEHSEYQRMDQTRGGSLQNPAIKRNSSSSNTISSKQTSSRTSTQTIDRSSRSESTESVYYDASSNLVGQQSKEINSVQICDSIPIASKIIDVVHYSLSNNSKCSNSTLSFIARLILGKSIEKFAARLLETTLTLNTATICINGITSSIWDESDEPPLDLQNASLDEAVLHMTRLLRCSIANHAYLPSRLLDGIVSSQMRFYLSQLVSQRRNKFVIYSFFVHLLDDLERD